MNLHCNPDLISFSDFYTQFSTICPTPKYKIIAELAGKDSVAAIMKASQIYKMDSLMGIAINHQAFYGNKDEPWQHFQYIIEKQSNLSINQLGFLYLDVSTLFTQLIIQTMAIIQKYFQCYSPCPACHLFFHMMRIPIARHFGIDQIITGERNLHGSKQKLNQLPAILNLLATLLENEKIELLQVLQEITDDEEIYSLLGDNWESAAPYRCLFSKNYYDENDQIPFAIKPILDALTHFYYPLFHQTIEFIEHHHMEPDLLWIHNTIQEVISEVPAKLIKK